MERANSLKEAIFSITNRCNLRCKMCDLPAEDMGELSTEQLKQAIKDTAQIGIPTIVFSGGEPLMRGDIFELASFARRNYRKVCVTTNGYSLDEGTARLLSHAGVSVVNISIEGPQRIHDYLRGKGTFNRAIFALENLRKHNIESTVATMVSRYNYTYLPFLVEIAQRYGATTLKLQPFSRIFIKDKFRAESFFINKRDIKDAVRIIEEMIELGKENRISMDPDSYLRRIPLYLGGEKIISGNGCNALWTSCSINARGDIISCWVLKNKLIGNIAKGSLFELWNSRSHNEIRESILKDGCPGCIMSCYDEAFERPEWQNGLSKRIKIYLTLQKRRQLLHYLKERIIQEGLKCWFYVAHRSFLRKIFKRIFKYANRRETIQDNGNRTEIYRSLKETHIAENRLKKEIAELG